MSHGIVRDKTNANKNQKERITQSTQQKKKNLKKFQTANVINLFFQNKLWI